MEILTFRKSLISAGQEICISGTGEKTASFAQSSLRFLEVVVAGQLLDEALACYKVLEKHTTNGSHGKAAVFKFLRLHLVKKLLSLGSDVRGVPSEVSWASTL
jgi:hypothetical protein